MSLPAESFITERDLSENREAKDALQDLILSRESVLLVGAGFSRSCGYPDWDGLLNALHRRAKELDPAWEWGPLPDEYLERAAAISECIRASGGEEAVGREIGRIFQGLEQTYAEGAAGLPAIEDGTPSSPAKLSESGFQQFHLQLVKLPFRGFFTTNYDYLLEDALVASGRCDERPNSVSVWRGAPADVSSAIREIALAGPVTNVLHLHGDYRRPSTVVLTKEQYKQAYGLTGQHHTHLFHLLVGVLMTRRVVFVGFSLDDPYIQQMAQIVSGLNWEWGKPVHFAILPRIEEEWPETKTRAKGLKADLGIESVYYEARPDDHSELHGFIERIYGAHSAPAEGLKRGTPSSSATSEPASAVPAWVTQVNRAAQKKVGDHED